MDAIAYTDFSKQERSTGKSIEVVRHQNADKLSWFKSMLGKATVGRDKPSAYSEQELMSKNVVRLCNLAKAKIRGETSEYMLPCAEADDESESVLLTPERSMPVGTRIV